MGKAQISDEDFTKLFEERGPSETQKKLGVTERNVFARRKRIETRIGRVLNAPNGGPWRAPVAQHHGRVSLDIEDGVVLVGSDGHYWPGIASTAHRAFVKFCKEKKPKAVIFNGDAFDGASISRHPHGWETRPTVQQEIEAVQERLAEIERATKAEKIWTLGNHDARYELRLATVAPEYAKVHGFHLKDFFPKWKPAWSAWINNNVVVKHNWKGGDHAAFNNAVKSGATMVTGHLHSLKVTPYSDYTGRRWGVDCGTLADPNGPQFDYAADNPRNHISGFVMLTFKGGKLLWPEVISVHDEDHIDFRGELIRI